MKETLELVTALAIMAARTGKNLRDDGRVSLLETAGYLADFSVIRAGLAGLSEIPAEFRQLDDARLDQLRAGILAGLATAGIQHRTMDITDRLMIWAYDTVQTLLFIRNAPPSAIAA